MVYFGTGRLLELADNSAASQQTQTMYGVWDRSGVGVTQPTSSITRSHLKQQSILGESVNASGQNVRSLSSNPINWDLSTGLPTGAPPSTQMGWYMDLVNTGVTPLDNMGERVLITPVIRRGGVVFTTMLPSTNPCDYGGSSWIMNIYTSTGGQSSTPSTKSKVGLLGGITTFPAGNIDVSVVSGSEGIDQPPTVPPTVVQGRQSWIRLQ